MDPEAALNNLVNMLHAFIEVQGGIVRQALPKAAPQTTETAPSQSDDLPPIDKAFRAAYND